MPAEILETILRNVSTAHAYGVAKGCCRARGRYVMVTTRPIGIGTDVEHVFMRQRPCPS
ncbi:hypothetical protein GCM10023238_34980 [Streptomyces heliomycini]